MKVKNFIGYVGKGVSICKLVRYVGIYFYKLARSTRTVEHAETALLELSRCLSQGQEGPQDRSSQFIENDSPQDSENLARDVSRFSTAHALFAPRNKREHEAQGGLDAFD